jgi:hypothetical protein
MYVLCSEYVLSFLNRSNSPIFESKYGSCCDLRVIKIVTVASALLFVLPTD